MKAATKMKPAREPEGLTLVKRLHAWYKINKGRAAPWGVVTMESLAARIGVGFSTVHFWFAAARREANGKLPRGLSPKAIRDFLAAEK